jgi:hypothetical protein
MARGEGISGFPPKVSSVSLWNLTTYYIPEGQ